MNFRHIALAAALVAASASASAAIIGVDVTNGSANDAELQLIVSSVSAEQSYQLDLGLTLSGLQSFVAGAGANKIWNLDSTFLTSKIATAADATWMVVGYDTYGDAVPDGISDNVALSSTVTKGSAFSTANTGTSGDAIYNATANFNIWLSAVNSRGTNPTTANGSSLANKTDGDAYWLKDQVNGNTLSNNFKNGAGNAVGTTSNFYRFTSADEFDLQLNATVQQYGNAGGVSTLSFNGSALTLSAPAVSAPVPEPESYAMLLAGLAAIGFMVRRRRAA